MTDTEMNKHYRKLTDDQRDWIASEIIENKLEGITANKFVKAVIDGFLRAGYIK